MSISEGSVASADDVMNAMGSLFNDTAQTIFEQDYNGFDSRLNGDGSPNLNNLEYDTYQTDTMTDAGNIEYLADIDSYLAPSVLVTSDYVTYDEFSDSVVNLDLWTITTAGSGTGSAKVTENGTYMQVYARKSNGSGNYNARVVSDDLNFDDYGCIFIEDISWDINNTSSASANLTIKFGGVTVWSKTSAGSGSGMKFKVFKLSDTQMLWNFYDGSSWAGWEIDTYSGTVLDVYNSATDQGSAATNWIRMGYVRYNTFATAIASPTDYISSAATTISSTVTNAIPIVNHLNLDDNGGSVIIKLTADGGSNWETATNKQIHRFANTGTDLRIRIESAGANLMTEYAIKYNLY